MRYLLLAAEEPGRFLTLFPADLADDHPRLEGAALAAYRALLALEALDELDAAHARRCWFGLPARA